MRFDGDEETGAQWGTRGTLRGRPQRVQNPLNEKKKGTETLRRRLTGSPAHLASNGLMRSKKTKIFRHVGARRGQLPRKGLGAPLLLVAALLENRGLDVSRSSSSTRTIRVDPGTDEAHLQHGEVYRHRDAARTDLSTGSLASASPASMVRERSSTTSPPARVFYHFGD